MRVVYVSSHPEFIGGGEYSLFDLMTHLPDDVEPVLLLPEQGAMSARAQREGIEWHVAPMPPIGWRAPGALWRWRGLLRGLRPDILHANNSRAAFHAGMAGRMDGIPMLFHCRINTPDPRLDWMLVRLACGVIANSRSTAGRFAGWKSLRTWVVHNGLDLSFLEQGETSSGNPFDAGHVILMVARFSRWKRHDLALEVFERVARRFGDAHLVLVGEADEEDWLLELRRRQQRMDCRERVHRIGGVGHKDLAKWYAAADVLLLPSDDEPFGRVLVEAMAAGVPPVAFAGGGVPEVVEDGVQGLLIAPGDVDAMAEAVMRLLGDDALRARMGEEGRLRARAFTIERHVERICGIYRQVTA